MIIKMSSSHTYVLSNHTMENRFDTANEAVSNHTQFLKSGLVNEAICGKYAEETSAVVMLAVIIIAIILKTLKKKLLLFVRSGKCVGEQSPPGTNSSDFQAQTTV